MASVAFKRQGDAIVLVGETKGHLGQSLYLREIEGREEGPPPPVDLAAEKRNGDFIRRLIESGGADTAHDLSDGGFLVAVAEMAMAGDVGAEIAHADFASIPRLFGEDQGRYLIAVPAPEAARILEDAQKAGVPAEIVGRSGGEKLSLAGGSIAVSELRTAHEAWLPQYMGDGLV